MSDYIVYRTKGNKVGEPPTNGPTLGHMTRGTGEDFGTVTLERRWVDNNGDGKRDTRLSRFAPGTFTYKLRLSKKNGGTSHRDYDCFEESDNPTIDNGQVHIANREDQLNGCTALGVGIAEDGTSINSSKIAYDRWHKDALAIMARENRDHITIEFRDEM